MNPMPPRPASATRTTPRLARAAAFLLAAVLLHSAVPATVAASPAWTTDFPAAKTRAAAERKLILMDFTGSDWCGWCIKMKRETLTKKAFLDFAEKNLVLVEVDFPERKRQPEALKKANAALMEQFKVESYPTLVVLGPDGKELGRTEYVAGGPDAFIAKIEAFKAKAASTAR
jgi:protein disulfide-isomerase